MGARAQQNSSPMGISSPVSQVRNLKLRERTCVGVCSEWEELDLSFNTDGGRAVITTQRMWHGTRGWGTPACVSGPPLWVVAWGQLWALHPTELCCPWGPIELRRLGYRQPLPHGPWGEAKRPFLLPQAADLIFHGAFQGDDRAFDCFCCNVPCRGGTQSFVSSGITCHCLFTVLPNV